MVLSIDLSVHRNSSHTGIRDYSINLLVTAVLLQMRLDSLSLIVTELS